MGVTGSSELGEGLLAARRCITLPVGIRRPEVLRLLGMGRAHRPPRPNLDRVVVSESEAAAALVHPRALVTTLPEGLAGSEFLAPGPVISYRRKMREGIPRPRDGTPTGPGGCQTGPVPA